MIIQWVLYDLSDRSEISWKTRVYEYTTSIRVYSEYTTSIRQIHDDYTTNIRWAYNEYYKTCLTAHRSAEKQEDSPWLFTCHCTNKHLRQQLRTSFWVLLSSLYLHILQQPFSAWSTWVLLVALYYTAGGTWDILIIDGYFWQKKISKIIFGTLAFSSPYSSALGKPDLCLNARHTWTSLATR